MMPLEIFRDNSFFIGSNAREAVNAGRADFVPIFLSEIPLLFHRKIIKLDVALINVWVLTLLIAKPLLNLSYNHVIRFLHLMSMDSVALVLVWM